MSSIKRIYLACRAAIAEAGPLTYFLGIGIVALMLTFLTVVNQDNDGITSLLKSEFAFWDPVTIISILVLSGCIAGLIVCDGFYNRWLREENQAVRTLSLPLSHGERFAAMLILHLVFVPLVCLVLPMVLVFLLSPLAPSSLMLPSTVYLWKAIGLGFLAHTAICTLWFQPFFAFGKKGAYVLFAMIGLLVFYIYQTHGEISETIDLPYVASAAQEADVAGLIRYQPQMTSTQGEVIKVDYSPSETIYYIVQTLFLLLMLAAGGLALTKTTA
jgi:hypothetical protein